MWRDRRQKRNRSRHGAPLAPNGCGRYYENMKRAKEKPHHAEAEEDGPPATPPEVWASSMEDAERGGPKPNPKPYRFGDRADFKDKSRSLSLCPVCGWGTFSRDMKWVDGHAIGLFICKREKDGKGKGHRWIFDYKAGIVERPDEAQYRMIFPE